MKVYDAIAGEVSKVLEHSRGIYGLTWSNNGSLLATREEMTKNDDGSINVWISIFEMPAGKKVRKIDFGNTVNELFFSHDDEFLLAVDHGAVKVFKVSDWLLLQTLNTL